MVDKTDKMTAPLVSVMTLTYNHENYIRQCLNGIVMQNTNFPFEVIVGEDCSSDHTRMIVREFEVKYPDIIKAVYRTERLGALKNMSDCYHRLKGKYIAVCEGDDYWTDPDKLQKQVDYLEQNADCVLCFHTHNIVDHNGELTGICQASDKVVAYPSTSLFHLKIQLLTTVFRNCITLTADEMVKHKMSDTLLYALLSSYGSAADLGFVGANYRQHSGGVYTSLSTMQKYSSIIKGIRAMRRLPFFNEEQKKEIAKEVYTRKKIFMMRYFKRLQLAEFMRIAFT